MMHVKYEPFSKVNTDRKKKQQPLGTKMPISRKSHEQQAAFVTTE